MNKFKITLSTFTFYFLFSIFSVVLIFSTFYFLTSSIVFSQEELPTPNIAVSPNIYYPQDEIIYLEGAALPDSTLEINFQKQGQKPITLTTRSDARGEWVLAEKVPMGEGDWQVRARIVKFTGETSLWSNPRLVKAVATGFVVGGVTFKFSALVFIMLLIFVLSAFLIIYFYSRMKRYQMQTQNLRIKELQKELDQKRAELDKSLLDRNKDDARVLVERGFADLRSTIVQELKHIEASAGGRALTRQEEEHKEHVLKQLEEIEKEIEIKIKSIG